MHVNRLMDLVAACKNQLPHDIMHVVIYAQSFLNVYVALMYLDLKAFIKVKSSQTMRDYFLVVIFRTISRLNNAHIWFFFFIPLPNDVLM